MLEGVEDNIGRLNLVVPSTCYPLSLGDPFSADLKPAVQLARCSKERVTPALPFAAHSSPSPCYFNLSSVHFS